MACCWLQVLLGLRKAYASALEEPDTPAELVIDAVILMLVVVQRRIFLSPDFQKIIDELWCVTDHPASATSATLASAPPHP